MAASSASMAASKLLNLRNPALQNLIRRQLLHPSASSPHLLQPTSTSPALPDAQSLNLFHLENGSTDSPNHSSNAENLNLHASNLPLNLQWPLGSSVMQIEAARTYVPSAPKDDVYQDFDDDDDDDEDDEDDIQNYSGSDCDDDDDYEDVDEDPDARPRSRSYRD